MNKKRKNQNGNAGLLVMIFLAFGVLTFLTMMAAAGYRQTRNLERTGLKLAEKWEARGSVNILAKIVARDAPLQLDEDVRQARSDCELNTDLAVFDEAAAGESSPAVRLEDGRIICTGNRDTPTSIFGKFADWSEPRKELFERTARERFNLNGDNIKIVSLDEVYRRSFGTADTAYAARFIVEAKFGNYRTRTNGEIILGATVATCGTSVVLEVNPSTVVRGSSVEMRITYAAANRLRIYNSANVLIHEEEVPEQTASQLFVFNLVPSVTETYYVVASGSGGCSARSANAVVTVVEPPPVCPVIVDFNVSSTQVTAGESVTVTWNVRDAATVRLDGETVPASGSRTFVITADRTFTIVAQDAANGCPVTRQLTVIVRISPPSCGFSTPQISAFGASPNSIGIGESSALTWSISGVDASAGTVRLTGPNGFAQTVASSGTLSVTPPSAPGDYVYTLTAENTCPDGTRLTSQATVVISVRACPPPAINAFTVTPSTVAAGGNQVISFAWSIGGTADAVSINNGVGGSLPASGTLDFLQPQTTTAYTLTAVGCGITRQAQTTVNVTSCQIPEINFFSVNPSSVPVGGNQTLNFTWGVSGQIDSQSIDQGIGAVTGNTHSAGQAQTTTVYTYTAVGCEQTRTRSATVTVSSNPPPSCMNTGVEATRIVGPESPVNVRIAADYAVISPTEVDVTFSWSASGYTRIYARNMFTQYPLGSVYLPPLNLEDEIAQTKTVRVSSFNNGNQKIIYGAVTVTGVTSNGEPWSEEVTLSETISCP